MKLTRRSLLSWLLGGSLVVFFGNFLWELVKFLRPPQELIGGGGNRKITTIAAADLPPDHSKVVRHEGKLVIVVRQANALYALSAACTHLGCIVHWKDLKAGDNLFCPCHEAIFDLKSGKVLAGPAPLPLPMYPVKLVQDQIMIGEA